MYSAIKSDNYILLSVNAAKLHDMFKRIGKCDLGSDEFYRILTPKNIDIISFVNDLAVKNKIALKYMIMDNLELYHPNDYIWHQNKYANGMCNIIIKDTFDELLMGGMDYSEECPGTKKIADTYISAYDTTQKKILNKSSLYIRSGGGIYSIIERNLSDFITYLSWVKINDVIKFIKSKNPEFNTDLAASYEIIQSTDGVAFDIIRILKENKDASFFMLDGKTGTKIKMQVDGAVPDVKTGMDEAYYHNEFTQNIAAYRAGTVGSLTSAIKSADDRLKRSMSTGVKTGLQLSMSLQKQGWEVKTIGNMDCFVYPNKVYVTTVVGNDGKRYPVPEDCREVMYLYDITVPIDSSLHGLGNEKMGVKARGFHPHRGASGGDAYHELSHATDLNRVCIGDLDGKPIEKIANLIDALAGAYQPSMMGNMAARCVGCLFGGDISVMGSESKASEVKKTMEYIDPIIKNKGAFKGGKVKKMVKDDDGEPKMRSSKAGTVFSV